MPLSRCVYIGASILHSDWVHATWEPAGLPAWVWQGAGERCGASLHGHSDLLCHGVSGEEELHSQVSIALQMSVDFRSSHGLHNCILYPNERSHSSFSISFSGTWQLVIVWLERITWSRWLISDWAGWWQATPTPLMLGPNSPSNGPHQRVWPITPSPSNQMFGVSY